MATTSHSPSPLSFERTPAVPPEPAAPVRRLRGGRRADRSLRTARTPRPALTGASRRVLLARRLATGAGFTAPLLLSLAVPGVAQAASAGEIPGGSP